MLSLANQWQTSCLVEILSRHFYAFSIRKFAIISVSLSMDKRISFYCCRLYKTGECWPWIKFEASQVRLVYTESISRWFRRTRWYKIYGVTDLIDIVFVILYTLSLVENVVENADCFQQPYVILMLVILCWWQNLYIDDFFRYVGDFVNVLNRSPTS